jgi:ABC-type multidrug transport system ATPase subunit
VATRTERRTKTEQTHAIRLDARELCVAMPSRRGKGELVLLRDVSFAIQPGELVAIVGGSGSGKTTLLNALAGVRPPTAGCVLYNGHDFYENAETFRAVLGYVPQDDIVHKELSVGRTLVYAGRLRLPNVPAEERKAAIKEVLEEIGLDGQADQRVSSLSGGQRKRTSIGAELLTNPGVFFLDEPTSGLDPATGRDLMRLLRKLADGGSTVLLTTHAPEDIGVCDRVIFLAKGGHLAFTGTPAEALRYFEVDAPEEIYERLQDELSPAEWAEQFGRVREPLLPPPQPDTDRPLVVRQTPGPLRQFAVLTERNFEILTRNTLTLAILIGAPILIIAMFVVLFRSGAFDIDSNSPSAMIMILFWVAFASFFFGLTYGLLQIVTEIHVFHRERLVNLQVLPYVLSKVATLLPVLVFVVVFMVAVLRLLERLPDEGLDVYAPMTVTLLLSGLAAIACGLLASAGVTKSEQATLALPLLCFPQVLFSGAILPVPLMAPVGEVIAWVTSDKWAFEALGTSTDLNYLLAEGSSPLGPPLLAQYEDSFSRPVEEHWLILAGFTLAFLVATCLVLARKKPAFT